MEKPSHGWSDSEEGMSNNSKNPFEEEATHAVGETTRYTDGSTYEKSTTHRGGKGSSPRMRSAPSKSSENVEFYRLAEVDEAKDFKLEFEEEEAFPIHFTHHEDQEAKGDHGDDEFGIITVEMDQHQLGSVQAVDSMTPEDESRYRRWVSWAILVSWISTVIDLMFGFIALYIAIADKSVGIFGFALENFLDVVTSLLIIWRFGGFSRSGLIIGDPVYDEKMERREQRAEVLIALLFLFLGGLTCLIALIVLYEKESPDDVVSVMLIAGVSIVVLALLALAKFRLSSALASQAFRQDAWVTTISSILSIGLLVGSIMYHANQDIWFIDSLVAIPLGGALMLYGLKTLCTTKWWHPQFWR